MPEIHPSSSAINIAIEKVITTRLADNFSCDFEKKAVPIGGVTFEFDFYDEERKIMGEIYSGIGKLSVGAKRKILADCFKLIAAEKFSGEKFQKIIVIVDEKIERALKNDGWAAKSIKEFDIEIKTVEIGENNEKQLRAVKQNQKKGISIPKIKPLKAD